MCNIYYFKSYNLLVIKMKKKIVLVLIIVLILLLIGLNFIIKDKDLMNKISLFISGVISLMIAYYIGLNKRKNGLIIGLIVGISVSIISLIIHYFFAKVYFDTLFIRLSIFILSAASGGVLGVNKKTD